jgi:predicted metallopeptidase
MDEVRVYLVADWSSKTRAKTRAKMTVKLLVNVVLVGGGIN